MRNIFMTRRSDTGGRAGRCMRSAALVICLAASALSAGTGAQPATGVRLKSDRLSFFAGHVVRTTVSEVGAATASSRVRIVLLNDADRVVARTEGVLTGTSPVRLDLVLPRNAGLVQLRVDITIIGDADLSTPVTTVEDLDGDSQTVGQRIACGPAGRQEGAQTYCCEGLVATNTATGE